jgi:hypothetical protein
MRGSRKLQKMAIFRGRARSPCLIILRGKMPVQSNDNSGLSSMTNTPSSKKRLFRCLIYAFIPLFYIFIFYDKNDRRKKVKNIIKRAIRNIGNRAYCQSSVSVE